MFYNFLTIKKESREKQEGLGIRDLKLDKKKKKSGCESRARKMTYEIYA